MSETEKSSKVGVGVRKNHTADWNRPAFLRRHAFERKRKHHSKFVGNLPTLTLHLPSGSDLLINKIKIILKKVLFLKLFFNTKTIRKIYNFFLNKIIPNSQQNFLQNLKQFLKNHVFADFKKDKILSFSTTPLI